MYIIGIEWEVIAIIVGASLFVDVTSRSGLFTWIALKLTKASKGDPVKLLISYGVLTVVFSAFLNNVTAMIIVGSLTTVSLKNEFLADQISFFVNDGWSNVFRPLRFHIINDEAEPWVEVSFYFPGQNGEADEFPSHLVFVTPEERAKTNEGIISQEQHTEFSDSFVIGAEVLFNFREVFDREEEETAA